MSAVLDAPICGVPTDRLTCFFCDCSLDHIDLLEGVPGPAPVCLRCELDGAEFDDEFDDDEFDNEFDDEFDDE